MTKGGKGGQEELPDEWKRTGGWTRGPGIEGWLQWVTWTCKLHGAEVAGTECQLMVFKEAGSDAVDVQGLIFPVSDW